MGIHIWTDTSANLPAALCKKLGIGVLPFHFMRNGGKEECCLDTDAFPYDEYYEALKAGGTATTSMINPEAYRQVFEKEAKAGNDVLYIGMSSGISGAYDASALAAREVGEEYPDRKIVAFDTKGASLGEGLLVLAAEKLQKAGADLSRILGELNRLRTHMKESFMSNYQTCPLAIFFVSPAAVIQRHVSPTYPGASSHVTPKPTLSFLPATM